MKGRAVRVFMTGQAWCICTVSASFKPSGLEEVRVGANFRRYTPNSDGTIFSDTAGVVITNQEVGLYAGARKRFAEDKVITTATLRADKNQNFDWVFSPAASLVWQPREQDYFRVSLSSALRNPTLADQYLYLDVGPATLVGNLQGRDSSGDDLEFHRLPKQHFECGWPALRKLGYDAVFQYCAPSSGTGQVG